MAHEDEVYRESNRIEYGASPAAEFVLYIRQSLRMIDLELGLWPRI
jgi:hypothetical protein